MHVFAFIMLGLSLNIVLPSHFSLLNMEISASTLVYVKSFIWQKYGTSHKHDFVSGGEIFINTKSIQLEVTNTGHNKSDKILYKNFSLINYR